LQLAAVQAGFCELQTFGQNSLAKLRLISWRMTPTGQHLVVRSGKTIKMYRFPVTDMDSAYLVLACLSVFDLLHPAHAIDFTTIPLHAYYNDVGSHSQRERLSNCLLNGDAIFCVSGMSR